MTSSTIFERAALRVHPDGSNVLSSMKSRITDAFGNVIATDAGGEVRPTYKESRRSRSRSRKGKRKAGYGDVDEEGEEIDISVNDSEKEQEEDDDADDMDQNAPGPSRTSRYWKEREAFHSDIMLPTSDANHLKRFGTTIPDSDFLKTIHYIASKYYSSRGLMLDAAIEYERERGRETRARLKERKEKGSAANSRRASRSKSRGRTDDKEETDDDGDEEDAYETVSESGEEGRQSQSKRRRPIVRVVDMTQALDGELLIALGILLEEDIRFHLEAHGEASEPDGAEEGESDGPGDVGDFDSPYNDVLEDDHDESTGTSGSDEEMDDT